MMLNLMNLMKRLGLPGVAALGLLAAAAWAHWSWLPQQQAQVDQLGSQVRKLRHDLLSEGGAAGAPKATVSPEGAWQSMWQGLPDAGQRTALQSEVFSSARTLGLSLSAVQFKGARDGVPGVWRQRMVIPVEGRYVDVRAWLTQLLAQPALSLDALDVQHTDVMGDSVKARVSVSLWWRKPGGAH